MKSAKDFLNRARHLDNDIQSKIRERETIKSSLFRSTHYKQDSVQESHQNKVDDTYVKLIELGKEIDKHIDELYSFRADLIRKIDKVPDGLCRAILRDYYINNLSWETVAELHNQSVRNVYNVHGEALKLFKQYNSLQ